MLNHDKLLNVILVPIFAFLLISCGSSLFVKSINTSNSFNDYILKNEIFSKFKTDFKKNFSNTISDEAIIRYKNGNQIVEIGKKDIESNDEIEKALMSLILDTKNTISYFFVNSKKCYIYIYYNELNFDSISLEMINNKITEIVFYNVFEIQDFAENMVTHSNWYVRNNNAELFQADTNSEILAKLNRNIKVIDVDQKNKTIPDMFYIMVPGKSLEGYIKRKDIVIFPATPNPVNMIYNIIPDEFDNVFYANKEIKLVKDADSKEICGTIKKGEKVGYIEGYKSSRGMWYRVAGLDGSSEGWVESKDLDPVED